MKTFFYALILMMLPLSTQAQIDLGNLLGSKGNSINVNVNAARIYIDGQQVGTGSVNNIKIPKGNCITVEVYASGFISQRFKYCNKKGMPRMEKSEYIELRSDPSYEASTSSDYANRDIVLSPKAGTISENWKNIVRMVITEFDAIEVNDNEMNYLRTSWVVDNFDAFTVRTRFIVRLTNESPQEFRFKIVSERAYGQTSVRADEKFEPWDRILKRYDSFLEMLQTRYGYR